ncbi:TPA: 5-oxoproline transporter, DUF979 family subunit [Staphylococcus pseudintermedius]
MEWLKLIGILIIVLGFYFKWDTIGIVLIAAIVTGLVSHMDMMTLLETLGKAFVDHRMVSLFILTLPMVGMIVAYLIIRPKAKVGLYDSDRLVQQIGTVGILPQFLAALGILFTVSGVGTTISKGISSFLPQDNALLGVIAYILGMVLFTMLMGNAFAVFTVITASIGLPFVIQNGGDPTIVGALAMTGGFCGTLLTPMAANFNTLPVALLEMKDELAVIKAQAPMAIMLIVVHIILMYVLAF